MHTTNLNDGKPIKFDKYLNRLEKCYGKNPNDVELGGKKVFANMNEMQKGRIDKVFGGSARKYNQNIVKTAHDIAEFMGCTSVDELMSIIEIVAAEVKGIYSFNLFTAFIGLRTVHFYHPTSLICRKRRRLFGKVFVPS